MISSLDARPYDALLGTMTIGGVERSRVEVLDALNTSAYELTPDMVVAADQAMTTDDKGWAAVWWRGVLRQTAGQRPAQEFYKVPRDTCTRLDRAGDSLWRAAKDAGIQICDRTTCTARRRFTLRYYGDAGARKQMLEDLKSALETLPPEQQREFRSLVVECAGPRHAHWLASAPQRTPDFFAIYQATGTVHDRRGALLITDPPYVHARSYDLAFVDDLVSHEDTSPTGRTSSPSPRLLLGGRYVVRAEPWSLEGGRAYLITEGEDRGSFSSRAGPGRIELDARLESVQHSGSSSEGVQATATLAPLRKIDETV